MPHVLLVDDDQDIGDTLGEILRGEGYVVRTASSGAKGMRLLHDSPLPDLVVLDVDMPVLTGPEMAHGMLLHDAGQEQIPVMLVSARHDLPEIAGRMGTNYFVQKTGDVHSFLEMIERALRERVAPTSA